MRYWSTRNRVLWRCLALIGILGVRAHAQSHAGMTVPQLTERAVAGDPHAQLLLGHAYSVGRETPQDINKALSWYQKAAEMGNTIAMECVGEIHENGRLGEKNVPLAIEWYKKAAQATDSFRANRALLRLSRAGFTKEKYGFIPTEGSSGQLFILDDTTPIKELVRHLAQHTDLIFTGKAYWIGYNQHMLSIAAHGDEALPLLESFVRNAETLKEQRAGLYTIHLIGIGSEVIGRFEEMFHHRMARETLWRLMKIEGLTDWVSRLLKRDPWPADIPAIMERLSVVKEDCPATLNSLQRYAFPGCPLDSIPKGEAEEKVTFRDPAARSEPDVSIAIDGLSHRRDYKVVVEADAIEEYPQLREIQSRIAAKGNVVPAVEPFQWSPEPANSGSHAETGQKSTTGTVKEMTARIKDLTPPFDYNHDGNPVFFTFEEEKGDATGIHYTVRVFGPGSARAFLLKWWNEKGRDRYTPVLPKKATGAS